VTLGSTRTDRLGWSLVGCASSIPIHPAKRTTEVHSLLLDDPVVPVSREKCEVVQTI
jgi:hypothetical protein